MTQLSQPGNCCTPCDETVVVNVPGPQGPAGADCIPCADGLNAFTEVVTNFVQPNVGDNETVEVISSEFLSVGQIVFVETGGYYLVVSKPDITHVELQNLGYDANTPPGAVIATSAHVSPAGEKGVDGSIQAGALLSVNNLNDVANVATSRTNLGLGALAVKNTIATADIDAEAVDEAQLAANLDLSGKTINYPAAQIMWLDLNNQVRDLMARACAKVTGRVTNGDCAISSNSNVANFPQRSAAGTYDIIFTNNFTVADYIVVVSCEGQSYIASYTNKAVNGFRVLIYNTVGPALVDPNEFSFVVLRGPGA